jgi:hypothetical protein
VGGYQPRSFDCGVGSHFHHRHVSRGPPCDPGRRDFPSPVLTWAIPHEPSQQRSGLSAGARIPPTAPSLLVASRRLGKRRWFTALSPIAPLPARRRPVPRAPLPAASVTGDGAMSRIASESITPPSSLDGPMRQTIALPPPPGSLGRWVFAGCRPPAGPWPFPTLSLHPLRRRLDPYPAVSLRCLHPFLPREHRPRIGTHMLGRREISAMQLPQSVRFRGCSHSLRFKLPRSLGPPVAPTADSIVSGRPGRLHHAYSRAVTHTGCGIATCPNWAIDTAGLPPAGLQSCRLLRVPLTCLLDLWVPSCLPRPLRRSVPPFPPVGPGSPVPHLHRYYGVVRLLFARPGRLRSPSPARYLSRDAAFAPQASASLPAGARPSWVRRCQMPVSVERRREASQVPGESL